MKALRCLLVATICIAGCSSPVDGPAKGEALLDMSDSSGADAGEVDFGTSPVASNITITPSPATVRLGGTLELNVVVEDAEGAQIATIAQWATSAPDVAEVTAGGTLIGREIGTALVTATFGDVSEEVAVRVVGSPVTELVVTPSSRQMRIGEVVMLTVNMFDQFGAPITDPRDVSFSTSDESVVTVDNGSVTAVSEGEAVVSTAVEGVVAESSFVVEQPLSLDRVVVLPASTRASLGEQVQFTASAFVGGATQPDATFSWSSSDTGVLTLDDSGLATTVGVGTAEVVATSSGIEGRATLVVGFEFSAVAAGDGFSCGVAGGDIYCWGRNDLGQLGHVGGPEPGRIAVSGEFVAVVAGREHACGLAVGGAAYCWGNGGTQPMLVRGGHTYTSLFAGAETTCGLEAGAMLCWLASADPASVGSYANIALGEGHTCASAASAASCWGSNASGQLGINSIGGSFASPQAVTGGYALVDLTVGLHHSCGTTQSGTSACWGSNDIGQVGDGSNVERSTPILLSGAAPVTRLAAGDDFTCGLTPAGAAHCWGANAFGQLGDGTVLTRPVPNAVSTAVAFSALSSGRSHVCGISVTGEMYCWGSGSDGQLGLAGASRTPRLVPWTEFAP